MIRAVLDANVFVSAVLNPRGAPGSTLVALRRRRFKLLLSSEILEEVGRVLLVPRIANRHRWPMTAVSFFLDSLSQVAFLTPGTLRLREVRDDPDDDRYLECAVEGLADYLVSGDAHLLKLREFESTSIVSPRAFLGILDRESPRAGFPS